MAASFAAVAVEQQGAESNIHPYISWYLQAIPVLYIVGNIVRKIAAIQSVDVYFENPLLRLCRELSRTRARDCPESH